MNQTQKNSVSTEALEAVKKEILAVVDEKFDVEAVAQMVEQLGFSKELNVSLQKSFQGLQADLQQKEQMIQYLQSRLNHLELDIALLKRTGVSR
jgi:septum formation topological specificity factor MinE